MKNSIEIHSLATELIDRFGPLVGDVEALLQVIGLRNRAADLNICKIEVGERAVVLHLHKKRFAAPEALMAFLQRQQGLWSVRPDQALVVHRALGQGALRLTGVSHVLAQLEALLPAAAALNAASAPELLVLCPAS